MLRYLPPQLAICDQIAINLILIILVSPESTNTSQMYHIFCVFFCRFGEMPLSRYSFHCHHAGEVSSRSQVTTSSITTVSCKYSITEIHLTPSFIAIQVSSHSQVTTSSITTVSCKYYITEIHLTPSFIAIQVS